ncbi:MAG: ATP-dependent RecD-like DNA helicase [Firmicutes bacterium]|nr:ATP-dependent RecD-like DNA helicase [Bacillota bacterium]
MVIEGAIEDIVFRNDENGYTVINIDCSGELITAVGKFPSVSEGEFVRLNGHYITNSKYGTQFAVQECKILPPQSEEAIVRYLSSGLIKGIGPVTAGNIVEKFGKDTLMVIEFNPSLLKNVKGVSSAKAAEIGKTFGEIKQMQNSVMFLQSYGVSTGLAVKIYDKYKDKTENTVKSNPYRLVEDVDGIGFKTADRIAQSTGIAAESEFRMRAGILHILSESADRDGNTYLPKLQVFNLLTELLGLDMTKYSEQFNAVVGKLVIDTVIKEQELYNEPSLMHSKFYSLERGAAQKLAVLSHRAPTMHLSLDTEISEFERVNKIEFHAQQKEAISLAVNSGVAVITGGPGTGKTTIIKCIINILRRQNLSIMLLAPTGRAAKRMSESCGYDASTIHRALMAGNGGSRMLTFNESNPLPADVIIVDEVSMVDAGLLSMLLKALRAGTKLVFVGDKNQLPSVGAGNVLADIIASGLIPCAHLTQIYRQSDASLIIKNAHLINNGQMPELDNSSTDFFFESRGDAGVALRTIIDLVATRIPKFNNLAPLKIQVLAPLRGGVCGVNNLNSELQNVLNPASVKKPEIVTEYTTYRLGDKVMQTENNYNIEWRKRTGNIEELGTGVFNGDIGFITAVDYAANIITVTYEDGRIANYPKSELGQLSLSYAITVHKSQGSEFDCVIIPILGGAPSILTKNLLYTGVTRAKNMVVLVGQKYMLKKMVENDYTAKRYSALAVFLQEQFETVGQLFS